MNPDLTEEEMRQALFGAAPAAQKMAVPPKIAEPTVVEFRPPPAPSKRKVSYLFVPRLRVTLHVGNVFERSTEVITFEADTLSTLQAEVDAKKAVRKKFKYVEVISIKPAK
jgi:hypothetical protein